MSIENNNITSNARAADKNMNLLNGGDANAVTERMNLSDSSSEDDDNWQQVPIKRKHTGSPKIFCQKRPHNDDVPSTSNRFESLRNNEVEDNEETIPNPTVPKPPPIFIPYVGNIAKMVANINKIISTSDYSFKSLRDGQVRLMIKTVESYRKIVHYFDDSKVSYHTFQLKQERAFRVVLKGIHHTTPIPDIKAMLLSLGHQVRSVRNIISRVTKQPLPMFFVDVDPKENNKDIFNIRSFDNAIIQVEAPKKYDDIVQCYRCQDYGHTKSYCKKNFRCVKCGQGHPSTECTKKTDAPPNCALCQNKHTANYKGCSKYQELLVAKASRTNTNNHRHIIRDRSHCTPSYNIIPPRDTNAWTYSDAVRGEQPAVNNVLEKIEAMFAKQIELTNSLMNMMTMLMNKLCK